MKRIISILAVLALFSIGMQVHAQNANRKGFFIELQGGAAFGEVLHYENHNVSIPYLKGGMVGSLDFGYRFRLSKYFAFDTKIGGWADFADFDTFNLRIMPGLRWTSKDFANNMSAYAALNVGFGFGPLTYCCFIPLELSAGLNLNSHVYIGLSWVQSYLEDTYWKYNEDRGGEYQYKPYGSLALRLGYRF